MTKNAVDPFPYIAKCEPVSAGEQTPAIRPVQEFLARFGYLQDGAFTEGELDPPTSDALSTYQSRNELQPTGDFDEQTREQMTTTRCGLPDLTEGIDFAARCAWAKRGLTYAFDVGTTDVAGEAEFQAVRNAFQTWRGVTSLTLRR